MHRGPRGCLGEGSKHPGGKMGKDCVTEKDFVTRSEQDEFYDHVCI